MHAFRPGPRLRPALAAGLALPLLLACAGGSAPVPGASTSAAAAAGDTVRGRMEALGSDPAPTYVVQSAGGGATTLHGDRAHLRAFVGLEVMVAGEREGAALRVARVTVRGADGEAAVDGVLASEGGRDVLVTTDGRRLPVPHLPPHLRGRTGLRVWLTGPLDAPPHAFGVVPATPATTVP